MIKIMIVDDSAVVRSLLKEMLDGQPDMRVIATAPDPLFAQQKMRGERPDVLILDIEMPRMDGLTFLRQLMGEAPIATIVFSSLAEQGSSIALDALDAGAVGIMTKPTGGMSEFIASHQGDFMHMIRDAAQIRLAARRPAAKAGRPQAAGAPARALQRTTDTVVAIGTSTGGTQALEQVLTRLPVTCAGLVIVQHMPANFTRMFAQRLNALCAIEVREARDNDRVLSGQALIAPGGLHLQLKRNGAQYAVEVLDGPPVSRHKPSVDVLFRSVARTAGRNALGVIMTGMGDDGARGMKEMHEAGATTLAQDEQSCVVFGMPREAIRHGGVSQVCALDDIPELIARFGR
jgi:two-component system chemotaxis response regulator CheB